MATSKSQRIGIAIILAVTVIGTVGSFAVMILSQQDATKTAAKQQQELQDYKTESEAYQKKIDAQTAELSAKYYQTFSQYASRVGEFNLDENNKELKKEDLAVGDGAEVTDDSKFAAYYIGWNPSGKVFDQSIDGEKLKAPLYYNDAYSGMPGLESGLKNASLIEGWKEGMKGMKIGGVRELTIPSDNAYGEQGSGDLIPPNTPIRFIVMAIPKLADIQAPEYPASLLNGGY